MTQTAKITMTADDSVLVQKIRQQEALIDRLGSKLDGAGKRGARGGKEAAGAFGGAAGEVAKFAAGLVGAGSVAAAIHTTIGAMRSEFEKMSALQEEQAQRARSFAEVIRETKVNFVADETMSVEDLEPKALEIAKNTRTDDKMVARVLSGALSAKGNLKNAAAATAVEQAFRLLPNNEAAAKEMAERSMDLAQTTGGTEDIRQEMGFLVNLQAASRVTDLSKLGKAATPAIKSAYQRGDTIEEGGELFATLNQAMADAEGNRTGTALTNLTARLGGYVPTAKAKDERGAFTVPEEQRREFEAAKSTTERIGVMQRSPELRRAFWSKNSFEAGAQAPIEAWLAGEATMAGLHRQSQQTVKPLDAAQAGLYEDKINQLNKGKFQGGLSGQQQADANVAGFELSQTMGQRIADARKILKEKALDKIDQHGIDSFSIPLLGDVFETSRKMKEFEARRKLTDQAPERIAADLLRREARDFEPGGFIAATRSKEEVENTRELLLKQINVLERMAEAAEAQAERDKRRETQPQPVKLDEPSRLPASSVGPDRQAAAAFSSK